MPSRQYCFHQLKGECPQKVEVRHHTFPLGAGHHVRDNKASPTDCWGLLASRSPGTLGGGQL